MDTLKHPEPKRARRYYSPEFKAQMVAACRQPGVSIAAMAMANQINPDLLQHWIHGRSRKKDSVPAFVPVEVSEPAGSAEPAIHLELRRGEIQLNVAWPVTQASACVALLKALLR